MVTPADVLARHTPYKPKGTYGVDWCAADGSLWPCESVLMARVAAAAEERVRVLTRLVEKMPNGHWRDQARALLRDPEAVKP